YAATKVPVGEVKVAIRSVRLADGKPGLLIPAKYGAAATSGLVFEATPGKQTYDVQLKGGRVGSGARVYGRVAFDGKPIAGATIAFHTKDRKKFSTATNKDGTYEINVTATGELKITLEVDDPKNEIRVPASYSKPEQTPLSFEIKPGSNRVNVEVKSN